MERRDAALQYRGPDWRLGMSASDLGCRRRVGAGGKKQADGVRAAAGGRRVRGRDLRVNGQGQVPELKGT